MSSESSLSHKPAHRRNRVDAALSIDEFSEDTEVATNFTPPVAPIVAASLNTSSLTTNNNQILLPSANITTSSTADTTPKSSYKNKQNLDYVIRSGIAGGLAGSAAKTLIAPLDRVKILFQTSNPEFRKYTGSWIGFYKAGKHIVISEGPLGLFRGHSATLLRIFPYAGIKFIAYEQVRNILIPNNDYETSVRRLLAGSLSGVSSVFCTYPLDLIRVRLAYDHKGAVVAASHLTGKSQHSSSLPKGRLINIVKIIYNEPTAASFSPSTSASVSSSLLGRVGNFYRGFTPTVLGMIPYAGVSFWAHDSFHDIFRSKLLRSVAVDYSMPPAEHLNSTTSRHPLKVWAQLAAGGLSGLCAQTASYPLEVVRRRMQVSGAIGNHQRQRMISTAVTIIRERGVQGLFVGLTIGYLKVIPMFACSFFVYERAKILIGI